MISLISDQYYKKLAPGGTPWGVKRVKIEVSDFDNEGSLECLEQYEFDQYVTHRGANEYPRGK